MPVGSTENGVVKGSETAAPPLAEVIDLESPQKAGTNAAYLVVNSGGISRDIRISTEALLVSSCDLSRDLTIDLTPPSNRPKPLQILEPYER